MKQGSLGAMCSVVHGASIGAIVVSALVLGSGLVWPIDLLADTGPMILSLGDDSYLAWSDVESQMGAGVRREIGENRLTDFSVLILSNISYSSLPEQVREGLREYVEKGGSLLITGGPNAYGSGGYAGTDLADLLPLRPSRDDWITHPFGPTLILQPGHPILKDVEIPTMAFFNELDLSSGAVEIAQYRKASKAGIVGGRDPGGGQIQGGGRRPWPLIAERALATGTALAIAIDMTLTGEWKDRDRFALNCVEYLFRRSQITPAKKGSELPHGGE